jgi:hypothetical protein
MTAEEVAIIVQSHIPEPEFDSSFLFYEELRGDIFQQYVDDEVLEKFVKKIGFRCRILNLKLPPDTVTGSTIREEMVSITLTILI